MDRTKRVIALVVLVLMSCVLVLAGCAGCADNQADKHVENTTLEVALYPYVPDPDHFRAVVRDAWERKHPEVELRFAEWDCYKSDPGNELDVFVFDSVFFSSFVEEGLLFPIPQDIIENREDIFPFALKGCEIEGTYYALPQLLCSDFLYTRKADTELTSVTDLVSLYGVLGDRESGGVIPAENEGLLVNLSGGQYEKTAMYLKALTDARGHYTDHSVLPNSSYLSPEVIDDLSLLWKMGGKEQVSYVPKDGDEYVRARWFASGKGRAYIGYSEALAAMGDFADDVDMRLFSYSDGANIPLFYADMVGINAQISERKKSLAFDLANILISEEVLTQMSAPAEDGKLPQYLLVSRKSVYDNLGKDYPIYRKLKEVVDSSDNYVFRAGVGVREFATVTEKALLDRIMQD